MSASGKLRRESGLGAASLLPSVGSYLMDEEALYNGGLWQPCERMPHSPRQGADDALSAAFPNNRGMISHSQHQNFNTHHFVGSSKAYHILSCLIKQSMLRTISSLLGHSGPSLPASTITQGFRTMRLFMNPLRCGMILFPTQMIPEFRIAFV